MILIREILSGVKGISFVHFTPQDVVRHHLVQRILEAYQAFSDQAKEKPPANDSSRNAG